MRSFQPRNCFCLVLFFAITLSTRLPLAAQEGPKPLRTWTSTTGTKIEASLISVDAQSVTLQRNDGKKIVVAKDKLSEADLRFIESTENPARSTTQPSTDDLSIDKVSTKFNNLAGFGLAPRASMTPFWLGREVTPLKDQLIEDRSIVISLPKDTQNQLFVAGGKPTVWMCSHARKMTLLGTLEFPNGSPQPAGIAADDWTCLAISPSAKRCIICKTDFDKCPFAILERTSGKLRTVAMSENSAVFIAAVFLNDNLIATMNANGELCYWNLTQNTRLRVGSIPNELIFTARLGRRPNAHFGRMAAGGRGELIAISSSEAIYLFDQQAEKIQGIIKLPPEEPPPIAFSPDGKLLAVSLSKSVELYQLSDGKKIKTISVPPSLQGNSLHWLGEYLLVKETLLVDTARGLPVWSYIIEDTSNSRPSIFGQQLDSAGLPNIDTFQFGTSGPKLTAAWYGQLYVAFVGENSSISSFRLPEEAAKEEIKSLAANAVLDSQTMQYEWGYGRSILKSDGQIETHLPKSTSKRDGYGSSKKEFPKGVPKIPK